MGGDTTDANFKSTCIATDDPIGNKCCHIKFASVPKIGSTATQTAVANRGLGTSSVTFKEYCFGKNGFIALGGSGAAKGYTVLAQQLCDATAKAWAPLVSTWATLSTAEEN